MAVDVATAISHPSWGNAAWILLDVACFADPTGAASAGFHVLKAAHAVEETAHAVDEANHVRRVAETAVHGNSLRTSKRAIGYTLRENETKRILKCGETTRGTKRYTKKFYARHNAYMQPEAHGTKREMHYWQHDKILKYKSAHGGKRPPLNKSDW